MADDHGVVGEGGIEVVAVEEPALRHDIFVVAVGLDDLAFRGPVRVAILDEFGHDAWDILAGAGGRGVEVDLVGHGQRADVVAVGVEEAGEQGLARQVDHSRGGALMGFLEISLKADGEDLAVLHGQGLGAGLGVVDGDDRAAVVDGVGDLSLRYAGGEEGYCGGN